MPLREVHFPPAMDALVHAAPRANRLMLLDLWKARSPMRWWFVEGSQRPRVAAARLALALQAPDTVFPLILLMKQLGLQGHLLLRGRAAVEALLEREGVEGHAL